MLVEGQVKNLIYNFIKDKNSNVIESGDQAMLDFAQKIEDVIYSSIKSTTITIPPSSIIVQTASGPGTNLSPIVLNFVTN